MCYEFSSLFERARARQLRKEQQREQQRAQAEKQQEAPIEPQSPAETERKPRETIPA